MIGGTTGYAPLCGTTRLWNRQPELRRQAPATARRWAEQQQTLAGRGHHQDRIRLREVGIVRGGRAEGGARGRHDRLLALKALTRSTPYISRSASLASDSLKRANIWAGPASRVLDYLIFSFFTFFTFMKLFLRTKWSLEPN